MWTDSHCHVPYQGVGLEAIDEAAAAGVGRIITVGTDAEQSAAAVEAARSRPNVWATVGLHPHDAKQGLEGVERLLATRGPDVVAVGECGLDYHYDHSPRDVQRTVFAAQVRLAAELRLALVIHTREAWDDTFDILARGPGPERLVFHCFTGGPDEARRALDLGGYLSFSGIATFKGADDVRAAAALCPLDRLLVETDAPYLAPAPHRGRPNRPAYLPLVGAALAAVRGTDVGTVESTTSENAATVFRLPAPDV